MGCAASPRKRRVLPVWEKYRYSFDDPHVWYVLVETVGWLVVTDGYLHSCTPFVRTIQRVIFSTLLERR